MRAIHETTAGELWIGTEAGWLHRFDPQTESFTRYRIGSEQTVVRSILSRGSALWLAVNGQDETAGLYRFEAPTKRADRFAPEASLDLRSITRLAPNGEKRLWVGTAERGLYSLDGATGQFVHYAPSLDDPNSLNDQHVRALYPTADGLLWIGTDLGGLDKLNLRQKAFGRYKLDTASFGRREEEMGVYAIHQSKDQTRWLGTLDGLLRLDPTTGAVTRYATDEGPPQGRLVHNTVSVIHEDQDRMLWLGTDGGLMRFDP